MWTINPSKHHRPMSMRVLFGTPAMCIAMDPPERRECVVTSSGANPSIAVPTCWVSSLVTDMILEVLTEWRP